MKTCDFSYVRFLAESTMFMLMPTKMIEMEWIRRTDSNSFSIKLDEKHWNEFKMDKGKNIRKFWKPSQLNYSGMGLLMVWGGGCSNISTV